MLRRNLKRVVSLLLAASMVFTVAGCGGDGTGTSGNTVPGSRDTAGTEEPGHPRLYLLPSSPVLLVIS